MGELVIPDELRFVELDTGIEEATNVGRFHTHIEASMRENVVVTDELDLDRV